MKTLITLILLFTVQCFATNYYVSTTASGSGNASSWANADDWTSYIHAGSNTITAATDSVYAGTYSAKYYWDGTNQNNSWSCNNVYGCYKN